MKTFRIRCKTEEESVIVCRKHVFSAVLAPLRAELCDGGGIVFTDSNVYSLYRSQIGRYLADVPVYVMPAGEEFKTEKTLFSLLEAMAKAKLRRDSTLIALGGGVVGDVGGLAASLYMRGIACIQVPTTLLAQTDSAIGGKTAIDCCGIKNLIGTFHQPKAVYADAAFFRTLPAREITCGLGEIVKYGALDGALFEKLCAQKNLRDLGFLESVVPDCIACKAEIVKRDVSDRGLRACLNLGHTTAHAAELALGTYSHGACVLLGMLYEARLAAMFVRTDEAYLARLEALIRTAADFDPAAADVPRSAARAAFDKKNTSAERVTLVVPVSPGAYETLELPYQTYQSALERIRRAL